MGSALGALCAVAAGTHTFEDHRAAYRVPSQGKVQGVYKGSIIGLYIRGLSYYLQYVNPPSNGVYRYRIEQAKPDDFDMQAEDLHGEDVIQYGTRAYNLHDLKHRDVFRRRSECWELPYCSMTNGTDSCPAAEKEDHHRWHRSA